MALDPEQQARVVIDAKLEAAGWQVQHYKDMNLSAACGVAVCELSLPGFGEADYLLYAEGEAIGVVEAKPDGYTLTGVEEQSACYAHGVPDHIPAWRRPLPFTYEATSNEIHFTNHLEAEACSRDVFHFHTPDTLVQWVKAGDDQLRNMLKQLPPVPADGLWPAQREAIENLQVSLANGRPRALIQMATGSGKTFTAAHFSYRLLKHGGARRTLFLVDRKNLGEQAEVEFANMVPQDDPRRLDTLHNIHLLKTNSLNPSDEIVITTVQRLFSMLKGDTEFDADNEEGSIYDTQAPLFRDPEPITYNSKLPIDLFDFIVVDECHRSIYGQWRQVLEYFDAFIIGLTATPSKQTIGFFSQNLVMEYGHERAVLDKVNVNYDVFRVQTRITQQGSTIEADPEVEVVVPKRDRVTREKRYEALEDDLTYTAKQLDRDVVAMDQIRTVIKAYRDTVLPEAFPGRKEVPKTLIFAKDDSHAEDIVQIVREEFAEGNDFCQKITYRTGYVRAPIDPADPDKGFNWEKVKNLTPKQVLQLFRVSYNPRIAVTVDMIATGTDVKAIEAVMFLRNVDSANYFEQMKGRGVRVIDDDKLKEVSPSAKSKERFIIVDAVGVCEKEKGMSSPIDRQPRVSFDKLLNHVAQGSIDPDALSTLAGRLLRLEKKLPEPAHVELKELAGGKTLNQLAASLLHAIDPDAQVDQAREDNGLSSQEEPTAEQVKAAAKTLGKAATKPFHDPKLRNRILEWKQQTEQVIDEISVDELINAGFDAKALERAKGDIENFKQFIEDNKDEITALQLLYSGRYANRLKLSDLKDLEQRLSRPPLLLSTDRLWQAYEAIEQAAKQTSGARRAADLVSLIRHTLHPGEPLTPFGEAVMDKYTRWLARQTEAGITFNEEQRRWLDEIAHHIATSLTIEPEDFESGWFGQHGSLGKAHQVFDGDLDNVLQTLNTELVA